MGTSKREPSRLRVHRVFAVALFAVGACLGACTIERTRGLGDPCLQDRECVEGLRCLPGTDNRTACAAPPGGLPDVVVVPRDAAPSEVGGEAGASIDAPVDVAADARDGGADAATPPADTRPPTDAPADATTADAAIDVASADALVDVAAADAPAADVSATDASAGE